MAESQNADRAESLSSPMTFPRRKRRAVVGVAIVLLMLFAAIWWLPRPKPTTEPVNYVRNADGSFSTDSDGASDSGLEIAFDAGQLNASNNISTTSSSSHSGTTWFACDSILVMNHSDHLLVQRATDSLVEQLKSSGEFQSVRYYPTGHLPEPGISKPDLYLTMDLQSLEESGVASTQIEASIKANLGFAPARSNHSYFDSQSLPIVAFNANISLEHRSTYTGIESSGAKFRTHGQNIAEALAKDIVDKIKDLREKFPSRPELPSSFRPNWVKAPEFQFLSDFDAQQFVSVHGLFLKNETFWRVEGVDIGEALLTAIHSELEDADWRGELSGDRFQYVRMSTDGQILTAFTEREGFRSGANTADIQEPKAQQFWIHYQSLFTKSERSAAFEELLTEETPSTSTLLALKQMGTSEQTARIIELLKDHPPATVDGWVVLARHYFSRDQNTEAIEAIQCAHLLHQLKRGSDDQIRSLLKKHKLERSKVLVVTSRALAAVGAVDATNLTEPVELEIGPEQLAAIAAQNAEGKWHIVALAFGPVNPATGGTVDHTLIRIANFGSSWTNGTWFQRGDTERIEKLGDTKVMMRTLQRPEAKFPHKVIFEPVTETSDESAAGDSNANTPDK